jgi:erythromycin esterase-like protein
MAENLRRLAEWEPPGTRIIFSAHDVHVSNDAAVGSYPSAGYFVRRTFGAAYYGLGLTFSEGSFQQRDGEMQDGRRMTGKFTTAPAYEGSIEWHLAQAGTKALYRSAFGAKRRSDGLVEQVPAVPVRRGLCV